MSKKENSGLRGGVRCNCGQEFEVICRPYAGNHVTLQGVDAVFLAKVMELAIDAFGGRSFTPPEFDRVRSAAAEIEDVFSNDE
jgi:hypothetical protein